MPLSVETPAPPKKTIFLHFSITLAKMLTFSFMVHLIKRGLSPFYFFFISVNLFSKIIISMITPVTKNIPTMPFNITDKELTKFSKLILSPP